MESSRSIPPVLRRAGACSAAVVSILSTVPAIAAAQGVRFTLSPSAEYTWWDKDLGITNGALYGGRVGADFGSLLSVSGYFHTRGGLSVSRDSLPRASSALLPVRSTSTDAATYGINLALRLSPARFAPFVSVGAGVMRFDPDSAPRVEQINYRYGGGFHYDMSPNVRAMVMVEDSRFRLAPGALFGGTPIPGTLAADRQTTRSNWVASAGLGFAFGGSQYGTDPDDDRWSLASIPVEAFAGRLEFDDPAQARQALIGVRTGIDVGNYVGLRGFYFQGRSGDLGIKESMNGYGAEAQFNLNASRGIAPFLILGGGRLDYEAGYRDSLGRGREDETALILGGGIGIRLSDQFRINAAARDWVRGPQQLDSVRTLKQLTNNWMFTVGLSYSINRSRSSAERDPDAKQLRRVPPSETGGSRMSEMPMTKHMAMDSVLSDSLRTHQRAADSARVATKTATRIADSLLTAGVTRVMTIQVPTVGEVYIRYGDSTSGTMRVVAPRGGADSVGGPVTGRVTTDPQLRQMQSRVDSLTARLRDVELRRAPSGRVDTVMVSTTVVSPTQQPGMMPTTTYRQPNADGSNRQIHSVSPYLSGFDQLVLGAQVDAGPIFGIESLRFVPDFAIGFGDDPSVSLAAGAQYDFQPLRVNPTSSFRPHLRAGLGFLAASGNRDSEFGVNIAYGVTYLRAGTADNTRRPLPFIEHQGINFFSTNRFLLGLRWNVR